MPPPELHPPSVISSPTPSPTTTTGPRRSQRGDDHARSLSALSPSSVCAHARRSTPRRGQTPPPRALALAPLPRGRPAQRTRRAPRVSPMPSARLPTPYSAAATGPAAAAMAPPPRTMPPPRASLAWLPGPRWTGGPAPCPSVHQRRRGPPIPPRRVAGQPAKRGQPWPLCTKAPELFGNQPAVRFSSKEIRYRS